MFGSYGVRHRQTDDGEKPFWISYADLMTALMILFLVVMLSALTAISKQVNSMESQKNETIHPDSTSTRIEPELVKTSKRVQEIAEVCQQLASRIQASGVGGTIDCKLNRLNFGEAGRFETDQYRMGDDGIEALRKIIPLILQTANSDLGKKWLKQVVVEGYTDTDGSYLYNLNLSMRRSEWVMCTLLRNDNAAQLGLTSEQRQQIKRLFLAGGVSFNDTRDSKNASRRVELRLQFYGIDSEKEPNPSHEARFLDDKQERCMI
jgi:outer membrane protein OmpA-like peptidoglycan-associated protein